MKKYLILLLLIIVVVYLFFLKIYTVKKIFPELFDTYFEIALVGKNPYKLNEQINEIKNIIIENEKIVNFFDENSELSKVNKKAKTEYTQLSDTLFQIIKIGYAYEQLTNRKFSILLGEFKNIYNDIITNNVLPDTVLISKKLDSFKNGNLLFQNKSIKFSNPDISIDLGSLAKGYVIDFIINYCLKQNNIYAGIINGGGDLRVFCKENKYNKKWRIGIQHPRKSDELLDVIELTNGAVATSGDYQRFTILNNQRFHHIINTQTGLPADENISATIIFDKCVDADVLATIFFIYNLQERNDFIKINSLNLKYLIMDKTEKISKNF
ncbi:MAG TPA: FAD:protein FMN transferase [bacterium]|nr:FAD:protein FMN transferase [bacterium]HOL46776.1 FAD:protein FMN transferase [bacterium]HPQ17731.1 FAD:protein FMN transferase [bacterium]